MHHLRERARKSWRCPFLLASWQWRGRGALMRINCVCWTACARPQDQYIAKSRPAFDLHQCCSAGGDLILAHSLVRSGPSKREATMTEASRIWSTEVSRRCLLRRAACAAGAVTILGAGINAAMAG